MDENEIMENYEATEDVEEEVEAEEGGSGLALAVVGAVGVGVGFLTAKLAKPVINKVKEKIAEKKAAKEKKNDIVDAAEGSEEFVESEEVSSEEES